MGLEQDATEQDIKASYKKLAMKLHPDRGGNEDEFKKVGRAYDVLSNSEKREIYDKLGEEGLENIDQNMGGFDPHELFAQFFQQQQTGKLNIVEALKVSLKDLYIGCKRDVSIKRTCPCTDCNGIGFKSESDDLDRIDDNKYICEKCKGKGMNIILRQMGPMIQQLQCTCDKCQGKGHIIPNDLICTKCEGDGLITEEKTYEITIKSSMMTNTQIRVKNGGHLDKSGNTGDAIFVVQEESHPYFKRIGDNLLYRKKITLADALCGIKFIIDFINDKPLLVRSRLIINPLKTYKLIGWGMNKKSDLLIEFIVKFPDKIEIKPEFKKQIKKYLKSDDDENIDTAGLKSSTLIEVENNEQSDYEEIPSGPFMGGIQFEGGQQNCQQQ